MVVAVVMADWWTKFLILNRFRLYEQVVVLGEWLRLIRIQNRGVSFGIGSQSGLAWQTPLLVAAALIAAVIIAQLLHRSADAPSRYGAALVLGGALGNMVDRAVNGGVTDFVHITYFPFVFNLADVAVTAGGLLLALGLVTTRDRPVPSAS